MDGSQSNGSDDQEKFERHMIEWNQEKTGVFGISMGRLRFIKVFILEKWQEIISSSSFKAKWRSS